MIGITRTNYYWRRLQAWVLREFASAEGQRARSIVNIRSDLAALGFPVDHLTDQELIDGLCRAGQRMNEMLPTAEEAARGLARLSAATPLGSPRP